MFPARLGFSKMGELGHGGGAQAFGGSGVGAGAGRLSAARIERGDNARAGGSVDAFKGEAVNQKVGVVYL